MTQHQDRRRLRALRAVLTGAACACRGLRPCAVDVVCVMIVVLIAHVDVVHAVDTVLVAIFVVIFCNWRCTLYILRVNVSDVLVILVPALTLVVLPKQIQAKVGCVWQVENQPF